MRYDDIEAHKSLVADNVKLVDIVKKAQEQINSENLHIHKRNKRLIENIEVLTKNVKNPFNWKSLKIMASFISIGFLLGALSVGGYFYAVKNNFDKQTIQRNISNFVKDLDEIHMNSYDLKMLNEKNVEINNFDFRSGDVVNGWEFRSCYTLNKQNKQKQCAFTKNIQLDDNKFKIDVIRLDAN